MKKRTLNRIRWERGSQWSCSFRKV